MYYHHLQKFKTTWNLGMLSLSFDLSVSYYIMWLKWQWWANQRSTLGQNYGNIVHSQLLHDLWHFKYERPKKQSVWGSKGPNSDPASWFLKNVNLAKGVWLLENNCSQAQDILRKLLLFFLICAFAAVQVKGHMAQIHVPWQIIY